MRAPSTRGARSMLGLSPASTKKTKRALNAARSMLGLSQSGRSKTSRATAKASSKPTAKRLARARSVLGLSVGDEAVDDPLPDHDLPVCRPERYNYYFCECGWKPNGEHAPCHVLQQAR
eukprot:4340460-Pyramimonas_sp.AAC.1